MVITPGPPSHNSYHLQWLLIIDSTGETIPPMGKEIKLTVLQSTKAIVIYIYIYCKSFLVEKFYGFHGSIGNRETFPVK